MRVSRVFAVATRVTAATPVPRLPLSWASCGSVRRFASLKATDPETYALVQKEAQRQRSGLELIASEVSAPGPAF